MKKRAFIRVSLSIALLLVSMVLFFSSCGQSQEPEEEDYAIRWVDAGLEQAVRKELGKNVGDIMYSDLHKLKIVHIWSAKVQFNSGDNIWLDEGTTVTNFDDLVHFKNLGGVLLSGLSHSDIDVLAGNQTLQRVVLTYNDELTDIGALTTMPKLVTVVIHHNNNLKDFSPLAQIGTLKELDLHNCHLESIDFLTGLEKLQVLSLHNNKIFDLSPIASSTGLQEIDVHANRIEDVSVMAEFLTLSKLNLQGNQISDLTPLSGLKSMSVLALDKNRISNLSPLEDLQNLRKITLEGNPVSAAEVAALRGKLPPACEIVWRP